MPYHQLGEHAIQLIVPWHGQCRFHDLQGKVLPQPVGDLWVIIAVETAEDEGEAAAAAAAFPGCHGYAICLADQGREGGRLLLGLFAASSTSDFGLRQRALCTQQWDRGFIMHKNPNCMQCEYAVSTLPLSPSPLIMQKYSLVKFSLLNRFKTLKLTFI